MYLADDELWGRLPSELKEMARECECRAGFAFYFQDGTVEDLERMKRNWREKADELMQGSGRSVAAAIALLGLIPFVESHRHVFADADTPIVVSGQTTCPTPPQPR